MQLQLGKFHVNYGEIPREVEKVEKPFKLISTADSPLFEDYQSIFAPINPDMLVQKAGYELFDKIRQDDQVSAVLSLKKYLILNSEWVIESEDENIVDFLTENFTDHLNEPFTDKLKQFLTSFSYGFSLTEKLFKRVDNKILLDDLFTRAPHSFDFVTDKFGRVTEIIQYAAEQELHINPSKFIHYINKPEFNNPYGTSEFNTGVHRAWKSKDAIIKFWNIYMQRHGMPLGVGTYPAGSGAGKEALAKAGKNIQQSTFFTVPEGTTVEFKEANKSANDYKEAIEKHNLAIARSMLVPDLLGFGGSETQGGSFALGEKQFEVFYAINDAERRRIEKVVNSEIVNPLIEWNFGVGKEAKFKFAPVDSKQRMEQAKLWLEATKTGKVPVNFEAITYFLSTVDFPEFDKGEFDQIELEKKEAAEAIQQGIKGKEQLNEQGNKAESKEPGQKTKTDKPSESKTRENTEVGEVVELAEYYRPLTDVEKKVNFKEIESDFDRLEGKYTALLGADFKLAVNALVDEIKRKKIIEKKRFDLIPKLELKHGNKIERDVFALLKESFQNGTGSTVKEFIVDSTSNLNDDDIAEWMENWALEIKDIESDAILNSVKTNLSEGIRTGQGIKEITSNIDNTLKGYDVAFTGKGGGHRVETIVRTNINTAYSQARLQQFEQNADIIQGYQISAIMDGRTSAICVSLDQVTFRSIGQYQTPFHHNCRTIILPILLDEVVVEQDPRTPVKKAEKGNFLEIVK